MHELKSSGRTTSQNSRSIKQARTNLTSLRKDLEKAPAHATPGWPIALTAIDGALIELSSIL
jgi:hypothetical protein